MEASEKAKELIEKLLEYVDTHGYEGDFEPDKGLSNAKESALIVATQTQLEFEATMSLVSNTYSDVILDKVLYWGDVCVAIKAYEMVSVKGTPLESKTLDDLTDEQFAVIHKMICGPWHDKEVRVSRYNWNAGIFRVTDFFGWTTEYDAVRGEITKTANGKDFAIENMDAIKAKLAEWGVYL